MSLTNTAAYSAASSLAGVGERRLSGRETVPGGLPGASGRDAKNPPPGRTLFLSPDERGAMDGITITHPLAFEDTPDEPLPKRVTVTDAEGTRHRVRVDPEEGTFEGTPAKAEALADRYGVDADALHDGTTGDDLAALQNGELKARYQDLGGKDADPEGENVSLSLNEDLRDGIRRLRDGDGGG